MYNFASQLLFTIESENIYCLVRMRNRELNRDQNLIGGQRAVQNWTEINAWIALVQCNLGLN